MIFDRNLVAAALPGYDVGDELGRGGWGVVLAATHRQLGRNVAIKQLPRAFAADPSVRQRFLEEARTVAKLDHPHIVPIYDFVDHDGLCLIVMERMKSGTLWDRFVAEGIQLPQAVGAILVASAALDHAHAHGVIHRDVKPENFLFSQSGVMKLSDFGIAKVLDQASTSLTVAGQVVGTPAYMAPEQALGSDLTPAVDIYACGVMLYELLTGQLPFPDSEEPLQQLTAKLRGTPVAIDSLRPDLPGPVADTIMRMLEREPGDRYSSAQELGRTLASVTTAALGPGWLRECGVEVHGAADIVAITERASGSVTRMTPNAGQLVRATSLHPRMGTGISDVATDAPPPSLGAPAEAPAAGSRAEELIRMMEAGLVPETDGTVRVDFLPPTPAAPAAAPGAAIPPPPAGPAPLPTPAPAAAAAPPAPVAAPPAPASVPPSSVPPAPAPVAPAPAPAPVAPAAPIPPPPAGPLPDHIPPPPAGPLAAPPAPPPPSAPPPAPAPASVPGAPGHMAQPPSAPPGPASVPVAPPVPEYDRMAQKGAPAATAAKPPGKGVNVAIYVLAALVLLITVVILALVLTG